MKGKQFTSKTTSCTICVAGKYQNQQDTPSTICGDCPTGRYLIDTATSETEHDAQTDCLFCVKGKQFTSKTTENYYLTYWKSSTFHTQRRMGDMFVGRNVVI